MRGHCWAPPARDVTDGVATILLRSGTEEGVATVTSTAETLSQGTVEVFFTGDDVPDRLSCGASDTGIKANGTATSLITATVLNAVGAPVTTATNGISFGITGQGTLVAPVSGNASDGVLTVLMKSTLSPGTATVTATSSNLGQAAAEVTTVPRQEKLICSGNRTSMLADGISTAVITATICDAEDVIVDTAEDSITFGITGEGTLVGTNPKAASGGSVSIVLRSTEITGTATVTATGDGLAEGSYGVTTSSVAKVVDPPKTLGRGMLRSTA